MDGVSNILVSIKNGLSAQKEKIEIPFSNLKFEIAKILKERGLIRDTTKKEENLIIKLKYDINNLPKIRFIERISKPSRRIYVSHNEIPRVRNGLGFVIVSTSKGVLDGSKARKQGVGGELICKVW